jgi:hypothetical protein
MATRRQDTKAGVAVVPATTADASAAKSDIEAVDDAEAELARAGIPVRRRPEDYGSAAVFFARLAEQAQAHEEPPPIARESLLDEIVASLSPARPLILSGSVGAGKSWLISRLLGLMLDRKLSDRVMHLDSLSLRARAPEQLSRTALSVLVERDRDGEDANRTVLRDSLITAVGPNDNGEVFMRYLRSAVTPGTLMALDQIDVLIDDHNSLLWLQRVVDEVRACGGTVVFGCRGIRFGGRRGRLTRGGYTNRAAALAAAIKGEVLHVPALTTADVASWIALPYFAAERAAGLKARHVAHICGGRPGLAADYGRYVYCRPAELAGPRGLATFAREMAGCYSHECRSLIEVLRHYPRSLATPLSAPATAHLQMIETGAIRHNPDGSLGFASPVYTRRYRQITEPRELVWLSATGSGLFSPKRALEIVAAPLRTLVREQTPKDALMMFVQLLSRRHLQDIVLFIADRDNARLWSRFDPGDKSDVWPLVIEKRASFLAAVRTGRRRTDADRRIYLPLLGTSGRIELVVEGRLPPSTGCYGDRLMLREIWNLTSAIQPALASLLELLAFRRNLRRQRNFYHRLPKDGAGRNNLLVTAARVANCSAVAVLVSMFDSWKVFQLDPTNAKPDDPPWEELLSLPDYEILNDVARHPSGRGLVLSGSDLKAAFPRLRNVRDDNVAAFISPVWHRKTCRLVIFLFRGSASFEISGKKQIELATMAPLAAAG